MRKIILFLVSFLLINQLQAQGKKQSQIDLMQGIWANNMNGDNEKSFVIMKAMNSLSFTYSNDPNKIDFPLGESIEGFQDNAYKAKDSINVKSLKEDGKHYTVVLKEYINKNGWVHSSYYMTPEYFECDGQNMSINGGQLVEYAKIVRLPGEALKMLFNRGKLDKRNYIKEYLDVDAREIKVSKSIINSYPNIVTKMFLLKGDVVTITGENADWYKIEFQGTKLVKGWIRKIDID